MVVEAATATAACDAAAAGPGAASTSKTGGSSSGNGSDDAAAAAAAGLFRREWQTYQRMLEHNLMFHAELFGSVEAYLLATAAAKRARGEEGGTVTSDAGLDVLDVGCGDSDYICRVLARQPRLPVRSYTGVDMSRPALELSARNAAAAAPGAARRHLQGDMLDFLRAAPAASADVVLASFSLHHLRPAQKREAVALAARALRPGGALVVVDIFLGGVDGDAADDRGAFLARFVEEIAGAWVRRGVVAADEAARIVEHVTGYDLPEAPASYAAWMAEAFGAPPTTLCVPPAGFYRAVAVELPAVQAAAV